MKNELLTLSSSIRHKLKQAGVAVVYFFGSRASGNYFPFSDTDIGIVLNEEQLATGITSKLYNLVYDILSSMITDEIDGPRLDIAFLQSANPVLAMKAITEGKILFESSGKLRADFEEAIFRRYDDYRRLRREYEEANIRAFEGL